MLLRLYVTFLSRNPCNALIRTNEMRGRRNKDDIFVRYNHINQSIKWNYNTLVWPGLLDVKLKL